jgi:hypothetical protein
MQGQRGQSDLDRAEAGPGERDRREERPKLGAGQGRGASRTAGAGAGRIGAQPRRAQKQRRAAQAHHPEQSHGDRRRAERDDQRHPQRPGDPQHLLDHRLEGIRGVAGVGIVEHLAQHHPDHRGDRRQQGAADRREHDQHRGAGMALGGHDQEAVKDGLSAGQREQHSPAAPSVDQTAEERRACGGGERRGADRGARGRVGMGGPADQQQHGQGRHALGKPSHQRAGKQPRRARERQHGSIFRDHASEATAGPVYDEARLEP